MKEIRSPFTNNVAELDETYKSSYLVEKYNSEFNLDVSKYLNNHELIYRYKCPDSGYRFFYPFDIAGDGPFYANLNSSFSNYYEVDKWEHEMALDFIREFASKSAEDSETLLEVGCAEGGFLESVLSLIPSIKVKGIDINNAAIDSAKKKGLDTTLESIQDHLKNSVIRYKFIVFFQVLEHISDVKSFLHAATTLLDTDGYLIIAVPNSESYILKNDRQHTLNLPPHHMGWWDEKSLASLSRFFPVSVVNIEKEPTDLKNIGEYYRAFLNYTVKKGSKLIYPLTRWLIKPLFKRFLGKNEGMSILAVYQKK